MGRPQVRVGQTDPAKWRRSARLVGRSQASRYKEGSEKRTGKPALSARSGLAVVGVLATAPCLKAAVAAPFYVINRIIT